jgi:GTP pyrophosphokinase
MCYKFAVGDLSLEGFLKRFEVKEVKNLEQVLEEETEKGNRRKEKSTGGIQITGTENTMYHFAKCCSPLPGDQIRGFVTRGRGIVIHRADCPNFKTLLEKEAEREIEVFWDDKELELNTTKYEFYFTIKVADRTGVLLDIVRILNEYKMEIVNVNTNMTKENGISYALIRMGIMIKRKEDFDRLANNLLSMPDVVEIIRK